MPTSAAEALAAQWEFTGLPGDPPEVEVVRVVTVDETDEVFHQCMDEQGFPSHIDKWGQRGIKFESEEDYDLADYICTAKYPLEDKYYKPFDNEQLRVLYDWRTETTVPCLVESFGGAVPQAPTFEAFATEYESTGYVLWTPVNDPDTSLPADTDMDTVHAVCPDKPPEEVLYPAGTPGS